MAIQNVIGDSFAALLTTSGGVGWESNNGFGMVLMVLKKFKTPASMPDVNNNLKKELGS
jgi:hypothetical protein